MAELVGLVASIVTLADTGLRIARAISRVADEFGGARAQIKSIATDTRAISWILRELRKRLEQLNADQGIIDETREVTAEIVGLCKTDIDDIGKFLSDLQSESGSQISVRQKTKWLFTKSKISLRISSLNSLKLTLTLLMHTLDFMQHENLDEHIKEEVERLVSESKGTRTVLVKAEQSDRNAHDYFQEAEANSSDVLARLDSFVEGTLQENTDVNNIHASTSAVVLLNPQGIDGDIIGRQTRRHPDYVDSVLTQMDRMEEDDFVVIAGHVWLQARATRFAVKVIELWSADSQGFRHTNDGPISSDIPSAASPTTNGISEPGAMLRFRFETPGDEWYLIRYPRDEEEMGRVVQDLAKRYLGSSDRMYIEKDKWCLLDNHHTVVPSNLWMDAFKPGSKVLLRLRLEDRDLREAFLRDSKFSDPLFVKRLGLTGNEREICLNSYRHESGFGRHYAADARMRLVLAAWGYSRSDLDG
ncbi:MAG: hypothetical protein Q9165_006702 [Trypethelium subeluteriae]